jgi:hypothetical protein
MPDAALFATRAYGQAQQQREIAPYKWVHPADDDRGVERPDMLTSPRTGGASLSSEKIPQARQLDHVVRRQDRGNHIGLRRGVNFIQMPLRFRQLHKLLDTFV